MGQKTFPCQGKALQDWQWARGRAPCGAQAHLPGDLPLKIPVVTLQESQFTAGRLKAQQEHQLWLHSVHPDTDLAPLWLRIPCHRASTSLSSFLMHFRFMTHQDLQGKHLIPNFQGLCGRSKKEMFPGCPPDQSRGNVQIKKSIFSAGNLNHLFL